MKRFIFKHWLTVALIAALIFAVSCNTVGIAGGCTPGPYDNAFAGEWRSAPNLQGTSTQLQIGHHPDPCGPGLILAYGYNTQKKYVWGLLSLTGKVTKTGVATESGRPGTLWSETSDGKTLIYAVLEKSKLTRNGSNLTIELKYKVGLKSHTEKIELKLVN